MRQYAARLAAETTVEARDVARGRNEAFDRLAKYIFGANRAAGVTGSRKIAMTTPVQTADGRKIAMTTPVQTSGGGGGGGGKIAVTTSVQAAGTGGEDAMTMRFFLPSKLTADTAPTPNDERVRIVTIPAETVAVLRFSGAWDVRGLDAKKRRLLDAVDGSKWRAASEPYTLFYDPPFTIPPLRRNEVAAPVEPRGN